MRCILLLFLLLLIGPALTVYGGTARSVYVIEDEADESGNRYIWNKVALPETDEALTAAEEIFALFTYFFETAEYCVPAEVCVLGVKIDGRCLVLNVSGDILRYGGNAYERALIAQLLQTTKAQPEFDSLTILVDGFLQPLAEGRLVDALSEF